MISCRLPSSKTVQAFSLVELSIVLVMLGLLVGGILGGKSLIRASELRNVPVEREKYLAATQAFKDRYFALPGDMSNASSFWGLLNPTPGVCMNTASTDAKTCNGDGDNMIELVGGGSVEFMRFWQHLANAGLVEGKYNGITDGAAPSKIIKNGWVARYLGTVINSGFGQFDGDYGNTLFTSPAFAPEEAWNIDTKLDDGKPGTGIIYVNSNSSDMSICSNASSTADTAATYAFDRTDRLCAILFRQQY